MPRAVDHDQRLGDIAAATIRVARAAGAHAVTIRSVALELGGSTTLVTNYLPTRAALILNALDRGRDRWRVELNEALSRAEPEARLAAVIDWALDSTADDPVLRTLILEIVANATLEPVMAESLQRESAAFREQLRAAAADAGFDDPGAVADIAYLLVRGAYVAATEDPRHWDDAHLRGVIQTAVAALPRHVPAS
jgi:AcrR family transcriptional regulator